ncbi:two-component system, NtrC family, nitrogen regulation sensor histidine kinase GlnL [Burkholderiales bacterium]|nr:two-component system, NtrC family, nitrogen regulation sensor histidine kinase GlnL [Burkholderiales bacterium]
MIRIPFLESVVPASYAGLEVLATAVLLLAGDGRVLWANPAAENLFELSRKKLVRRRPEQIFGACPALSAAISKAAGSGASYTEQELELGVPGKPRLHLTCTATQVDLDDAEVLLEFRHIDQQLKIAREERLNEQQQANRELIRSLAHEIKNPLGGIRGAAQLLEGELDDPRLAEYTQVIIGESDRLQSLVNRLLTPHRLPRYLQVNVHEILVRVKGVVQAEFPKIPIACDFDISLPELVADPEQIAQAALNVVRNAAQALAGTTADPRIVLSTRIARNAMLARRFHRLAVAIAVEDNGPGVPEALREKIFFPLVSGREGGSGLGLTIAQTFVAQHGGTIECESRPGRTVFTILLPLEPPRGAN